MASKVWTKENLLEATRNCYTYDSCLRFLGLNVSGGNKFTLKKYLSLYEISDDWYNLSKARSEASMISNKNKNRMSDEEFFTREFRTLSQVKRKYMKIVESEICVECGLGNTWNNQPLVLQLDHIDGDNCNNLLENLRLLCPNCHSQTSTFSNKKRDSI
jgi:hypothetical protein